MKKILFYCAVLCGMAVTVQAQNVGIGTTNPKARLHVADSAVVFTGPASLPGVPGKPPISGAGTRMLWYPNKAAFRAGNVNSTQWDEPNVGNFSAAFGSLNKAGGINSASFGSSNTAGGIGSFTAGSSNSANGNYASGFGYDNDAASYASFSIGRYNIDAGSNTTWVETDPLFTIGNGYTYETTPGVVVKYNRNAFEVLKNGNASVGNRLYVNDNLSVYGNADIDGRVTLDSSLFVHGVAGFTGTYASVGGYLTVSRYLNVDTINTLKALNSNFSSGTMPDLNLVPLGVVEFYTTFDRSSLDHCYRGVTNLAGNFIASSSGTCDDITGVNSKVGISLIFDVAQASLYKKVIAVPSVTYDGSGGLTTTWNSKISNVTSKVVNDAVTLKSKYYYTGFESEDLGTFGTYEIRGTVMFYGIK